jgi:hypothetical protein
MQPLAISTILMAGFIRTLGILILSETESSRAMILLPEMPAFTTSIALSIE